MSIFVRVKQSLIILLFDFVNELLIKVTINMNYTRIGK